MACWWYCTRRWRVNRGPLLFVTPVNTYERDATSQPLNHESL